jgi:subtilisin
MKYRILAVLCLTLLVGCGDNSTQVNPTQPPIVNPPIVNPPVIDPPIVNPTDPNLQPALSVSVAQRGETVEILNTKFVPGATVKVNNENAEVTGAIGGSFKFAVPKMSIAGSQSVVIRVDEKEFVRKLNIFVDSSPITVIPIPPTAPPELVIVTIQTSVNADAARAAIAAAGFALVNIIAPAGGVSGDNPCDRLTYGLEDTLGRSPAEVMQALQKLKEIIYQINPLSRGAIRSTENLTPQQILPLATAPFVDHSAAIGIPAAHARGFDGTGIVIAVLDTGVTAQYDMTNVTTHNVSFTGDDVQGDSQDYLDISADDEGMGHGTGVASLAGARNGIPAGTGVAPGALIDSIRVCDRYGRCRASDVIQGVCYAIKQHDPKKLIINMSLGGTNQSETLDDILRYAISQGALVVAAGGNDGLRGNMPNFPAASPKIAQNDGLVTVAALEFVGGTWKHAGFSTSGAYIDIAAPGTALKAACLVAAVHDLSFGAPVGLRKCSREGTSFAAPLVAGALALWRQAYPNATPAELEALLKANASPVTIGTPETVGAGMINLNDQPSLTVPVEPDKYQKVTLNFSELVGKIQIYKLDAKGARSEIAYLYDNGAFDLTPYLDAGAESTFVIGNVVDPGGVFSRPRRYLRTIVTADDQTIGGVAYGCGSCSSGDVYTFTINKKLGTIR